MAEITSSDFKKLIEAQQATTRQVMTAEERAADDAKKAEQSRIRSEAAIKGHETRLTNQSQNTEIEATQESQETAEDSQESEEKSVGFLGKIANFMGLEKLRGSAEAEDSDKEESRGKKMLTFMGKTASFLGDITKQGYEKVKSGLSGFKKFAFGALAIAALAFLNSPKFEEIKNTILDVVIPAAAYLYDNVIKPIGLFLWDKLVTVFQDIRAVLDGKKGIFEALMNNKLVAAAIGTLLLIKLLPLFKGIILVVKGIITAVKFLGGKAAFGFIAAKMVALKALFATTIIPAISAGLLAIKTFFLATLAPFLAAAAVPILAVTAVAAAIALALYSLKKGFDSFMFELEATGSVWEAIKSGIVTTISNILGFPYDLLKDGVSWIIGKIGSVFGLESFTNASKVLDDFSFVDMMTDMLTFLGDSISGIFDGFMQAIQDFLRSGLLGKFGGSKVADKLFGTKEEQEEKIKAKEEEQKQFELNRKALREKQKLEKEAEEAKKIEAAKKKEAALKVDQGAAVAKTGAISQRADPRQFGGGAPIAVNAPTNVNSSSTTSVTQNNRSLAPKDRAMDQIALAY